MSVSQNLSDENLISQLKELAGEERKILSQILACLHEADKRKLFLNYGCTSLFEFCMKELSYSEGAAHRRISAMRLIFTMPEEKKLDLKEKIESGVFSLTVLAQAQQFFNQEKKINSKKYSTQEKLNLLGRLENKSKKETEKELARISPLAVLPKESLRPINEDKAKLEVVIDTELQEKLEKIKDLLSHKIPNATYNDLLHEMADLVLKKIDPPSPPPAAVEGEASMVTEKITDKELVRPQTKEDELLKLQMGIPRSRYIPRKLKIYVWKRDQGRCTHVYSQTKERCAQRRFIQIDHIRPFSHGGSSLDPHNLRLLCGVHNRER